MGGGRAPEARDFMKTIEKSMETCTVLKILKKFCIFRIGVNSDRIYHKDLGKKVEDSRNSLCPVFEVERPRSKQIY